MKTFREFCREKLLQESIWFKGQSGLEAIKAAAEAKWLLDPEYSERLEQKAQELTAGGISMTAKELVDWLNAGTMPTVDIGSIKQVQSTELPQHMSTQKLTPAQIIAANQIGRTGGASPGKYMPGTPSH